MRSSAGESGTPGLSEPRTMPGLGTWTGAERAPTMAEARFRARASGDSRSPAVPMMSCSPERRIVKPSGVESNRGVKSWSQILAGACPRVRSPVQPARSKIHFAAEEVNFGADESICAFFADFAGASQTRSGGSARNRHSSEPAMSPPHTPPSSNPSNVVGVGHVRSKPPEISKETCLRFNRPKNSSLQRPAGGGPQ